MTIYHSCCPGKTDIHAPVFERQNTMELSERIVVQFKCVGCQMVIYVDIPAVDATPENP